MWAYEATPRGGGPVESTVVLDIATINRPASSPADFMHWQFATC